MQAGRITRIRTNSLTDLQLACAQNAMITVDIKNNSVGAGGAVKSRIRSLTLMSDQQLAWEINFFGTADYVSLVAVFESVHFLGRFGFQAADGSQIAGAGAFYYYIDGLDIAYQDFDFSNKVRNPVADIGVVHVGVVNRSATAKNAGATGRLVVGIGIEDTLTGA